MAVCKRVIYSGRVQGVGFRYTTQRLAGALPVTGFVKNLPSGQVELVVEGDEQVIAVLMDRVTERMERYITKADVSTLEPRGFSDFRIQH